MWTILEEVTVNQRRQYRVQCDCGVIEIRRKDHIATGRTVSCKKCASKRTYLEHGSDNPILGKKGIHKGVGDLNRVFFNHYKYGAERRGLVFDVTIEYVWELYLTQRGKCALSGVPITISPYTVGTSWDSENTTASLDRINSDVGYIIGNVQWVHKDVNYIKRDLQDAEFISWCKLIAANN